MSNEGMNDDYQVFSVRVHRGNIGERELKNVLNQVFIIAENNKERRIHVECEYDSTWKIEINKKKLNKTVGG